MRGSLCLVMHMSLKVHAIIRPIRLSQAAELNAAWNTAFRRLFKFGKFESVGNVILDLQKLRHSSQSYEITF